MKMWAFKREAIDSKSINVNSRTQQGKLFSKLQELVDPEAIRTSSNGTLITGLSEVSWKWMIQLKRIPTLYVIMKERRNLFREIKISRNNFYNKDKQNLQGVRNNHATLQDY